jgi:hypothetical protein
MPRGRGSPARLCTHLLMWDEDVDAAIKAVPCTLGPCSFSGMPHPSVTLRLRRCLANLRGGGGGGATRWATLPRPMSRATTTR